MTKKVFIKAHDFDFYDYPFVGSIFLILSQEFFNTILNHKQHLSAVPWQG